MMPRQDPKDDAFDPRLFTTWAEALKPITPPPALRDRLMARVRAEMGDQGLRTIRAGEGWVECMPGIEFKMLYRDETTGARSLFARLDPGVAMPAHDHGFPEECLVPRARSPSATSPCAPATTTLPPRARGTGP
jgi:ChrR-like protein with cupin domain